ncbi:MAG: 3D-(3,5/4)-trihydroxycyclohexane-1,2-dione acylhydrolase (decyclizing) [Thermomicrobiales bacterium]
MKTIRMTTAQAIVRFLGQQCTSRDGQEQRLIAGMFGIFGHGNVTGMGQALEEVGQDMRYYQPRNEQAMVHTAVAFAKMKNRLQTLACTTSIGPGATNMLTGAAVATVNRLPVLLLPGDIFASRLPNPVLQQLEHPWSQDVSVNDAFRPVSKFWDRINRPEQILASLPEAMRVMTDQAETGAVTMALPQDVQPEAYDYPASFFEKRVYRIARPLPPDSELSHAAELVRSAKRPIIVAGGGAIYSDAVSAIAQLAEAAGIPVVETQAGKGVLPWNHPWNAGPVGTTGGIAANRLAAQADLVLAVGTRLSDFTSASHSAFQHPAVQFIGLNIQPMDAYKFGAHPVIGDARAGIRGLYERLQAAGYTTSDEYAHEIRSLKEEWDTTVEQIVAVEDPNELSQANVIGIVNEASEARDVVVCAAGGMPGDLHKLWRTLDPKGYHLEYGYSCMGYEIAGGLGVKMADPSREVFILVGDGSYLMLHTEIVTSLQEGYKLTIVLVDNSGFQCIRNLQMSAGSPAFGNELRLRNEESGRLDGGYMPIDFAQNAESLGARAYRASNESDLRRALAAAKAESRTVLIHVPVKKHAMVPGFESWWDVPVAEVSDEPSVQEALATYQEARKRQRYFH